MTLEEFLELQKGAPEPWENGEPEPESEYGICDHVRFLHPKHKFCSNWKAERGEGGDGR